VRVKAMLETGEREFWIHPVVPPQPMLRQGGYIWYESVFNLIRQQRYRARMRIYPEAVWTNGYRWLTFLLVVQLSLNPLLFPNVPSFAVPINIVPARFHKKKRALLVCKTLRRSWRCTSLEMAGLDIYRFLLVHGYRQEVIGATPIWFGHISPRMLLSNYPFNPNVRNLPFACRSRLYPERYWLKHSSDMVSIGLSELVSYPGAGSAGLGLFADCSANEVPFEELNPNAVVFEDGAIICKASRPRVSRLDYNDNYGYWTNKYIIWSNNETIAYNGSSMRDSINYANDDLFGRWNARISWEVDATDGRHKWFLRATRKIYSGEEITWSYGWDYWLHHSRHELQLFAWRCYVLQQDLEAMAVDEKELFCWLINDNPQYSFVGYLDISDDDASRIIPSTYRP